MIRICKRLVSHENVLLFRVLDDFIFLKNSFSLKIYRNVNSSQIHIFVNAISIEIFSFSNSISVIVCLNHLSIFISWLVSLCLFELNLFRQSFKLMFLVILPIIGLWKMNFVWLFISLVYSFNLFTVLLVVLLWAFLLLFDWTEGLLCIKSIVWLHSCHRSALL